jgi:hypothetical protein
MMAQVPFPCLMIKIRRLEMSQLQLITYSAGVWVWKLNILHRNIFCRLHLCLTECLGNVTAQVNLDSILFAYHSLSTWSDCDRTIQAVTLIGFVLSPSIILNHAVCLAKYHRWDAHISKSELRPTHQSIIPWPCSAIPFLLDKAPFLRRATWVKAI